MGKKCIICGKEAEYCVKDSNEYYCKECALENFGDLSYLITAEEQAKRLKDALEKELEGQKDNDYERNEESKE